MKLIASPGIAALTTMLGLGLVISVIGAAMGLVSFFESSIALSQAKSQEAYLLAQSGAQDALLRIARDKGCHNTDCAGYTLTIGDNTATVIVTAPDGKRQILSTGTAARRKRRLQVDIAVDDTTGALTLISWKEVSL